MKKIVTGSDIITLGGCDNEGWGCCGGTSGGCGGAVGVATVNVRVL